MDLKQQFSYPWPLIGVVLDGSSVLDVPRLELRSMEEATTFIRAYGFDPSNTDDMEQLWKLFEEAVAFIERSLADPEHSAIPSHLRERAKVNDLRRLLLIASEPLGHPDQLFACAILRVMHALIHITHDPRMRYFEQVQSQILNRLDAHLSTDPVTGTTYLGKKEEGTGIKLVFFKRKDRKDRDRELIKLLHKASNLVEEIYDRIGFRLVTETKFDTIRAIRLMLEKNIISLPNVRPGRSRNRLVDLKRVIFEVDRIVTHLNKYPDKEPAPYIDKMIRRLEGRIGASRKLGAGLINPHSSDYFRSIQFTCRELIKIKSPTFQMYERLKEQIPSIHGVQQILQECFPVPPRPYEYLFFPYEIQLMDVKAYADSIFGKSNHEEYRKKQLDSARDRVFGRGIARKK